MGKRSRCVRIALLAGLFGVHFSASATDRGELSNFTGLYVVVTNDFKENDVAVCGVDVALVSEALRKMTSGTPFVLSSTLGETGERAGFLVIRLEGFPMNDSCVIHLLYQVKAAVDISHNGRRTEAAISSRSTIGRVKKAEIQSEVLKIVTIWSNELIQDWRRDNIQRGPGG